MNKKTIISIIILLAVVIIAVLLMKKEPEIETPIEETSPRNDIVIDNTVSTSTEPVKTVRSYSLAEVALHDKPTDCWLVIDSKVINPTDFIAKGLHPNDKILSGCGKDATSIFKNIPKHSGPTPQEALKAYEIGVLK